ncbi:MAG: asparagine synthase (glutamine-hydrolyzing), partial [Flavobacteriales bacterium]|nr:asparagine synthase (glutamine-hydrolyzing) [Flavobacteriales bacterium]
LAHRGPDSEGSYTDETIVLGHRRLSIIDTSPAGNQPFYSEDGNLVLVFNGEIYNYLELKAELSDTTFKTSCDTEVLLAAYRKWGIDCLGKLNGMFAFALWDKGAKELYLVRDRFGIKPLYVSRQGQHLVFSSEMRALLSSGLVPKTLDKDALVDYMRYQTVQTPATIIEGVEMLLPGHFVKVTDNETSHHSYWNATTDYSEAGEKMSTDEIQQEVYDRLKNSVKLRMRADVPFGAFLSGGIDSSAIVGLMSEVATQPVSTFSVTFEEDEFSEAPFSNMIAQKFATNHTEIKLSVNDFLNDLPNALAAMDHPSGDGPNTYVISKVTKSSGITMALSGLGGDELFAGYDVFKRILSLQSKRWVMSFPKGLRSAGTGLLKRIRPGTSSEKIHALLGQDYLDFEYVYPINRQLYLDSRIPKLLNRSSLPQNSNKHWIESHLSYGSKGFDLPWLSKVSVAEMYTYMQNVLLRDSDQMSMAHALEVRVPFLDHELAEFVLGVTDNVKYPHSPKKLLVDSLGDLLPNEIVNRPKMGFTFPWAVWLENELKDFASDRLMNLARRDEFVHSTIEKLWNQFLARKLPWSRIWPLIVLENWLTENGIH